MKTMFIKINKVKIFNLYGALFFQIRGVKQDKRTIPLIHKKGVK